MARLFLVAVAFAQSIIEAFDMDLLPDFLKPLEYLTRPFPHEAARVAVARRDESTPHLLRALEWADQHPDEANDAKPPFMLHIFALFILAQFREQRAYAPIVQMFRNPKFEELTGEVFTENLQAILASVCNGDTSLIEKLIEDEGVDEYVRGSAVESLGILANCGIKPRGEVSGYFRVLFRGRLSRGRNHVWDSLISVCTDLRMAEHLDDIRTAYEGNIADPIFCSLDEVEKEIVLPIDSTARHFRERYKLIDDAVAELEVWSCFDPDHEEDDALPAEDDFFREDSISDTVPFVRDTPKVGRNEPCPCGSGKKYKKCCGSPAA